MRGHEIELTIYSDIIHAVAFVIFGELKQIVVVILVLDHEGVSKEGASMSPR